MSDTPRTDAAVDHYIYNTGGTTGGLIEFARELEKENATLKSQLAEARGRTPAELEFVAAFKDSDALECAVNPDGSLNMEAIGSMHRLHDAASALVAEIETPTEGAVVKESLTGEKGGEG